MYYQKKNITNSSHKKATNRCNIQFVLHKSRKPRHGVPQCGITATMRYLHRRIQERAGERGKNKKKGRREPAGEGFRSGRILPCRFAGQAGESGLRFALCAAEQTVFVALPRKNRLPQQVRRKENTLKDFL